MSEILVQGGVKYEEGLPLPYVKYPSLYFFILEFGESEDGKFYVCDCFRKSIEYYWKKTISNHNKRSEESWEERYKKGYLGNQHQKYYGRNYNFKEGICHECNDMTPSVEYCHPMYGGKFKRKYGWYIEKYYNLLVNCPKDEKDDDIKDMLNTLNGYFGHTVPLISGHIVPLSISDISS